jgi:transposase-like protein
MSVRLEGLLGRDRVGVVCPGCKRTFVVRVDKIFAAQAEARPVAPAPPAAPGVRALKATCPGCRKPFAVPLDKVSTKSHVSIRCSACQREYRLSLAAPGDARRDVENRKTP